MAIQDNLQFNIVSSTINWDEQGIANASLVATIGKDLAVAKALSMQAHPDYPYMLRSGGRVTAKAGVLSEITLEFTGIDPNLDGQVMTNIRAATSTEPIDTHPNFGNGIDDGWAAAFDPQFNEDGSFKAFPPKHKVPIPNNDFGDLQDAPNPKAGIESYLEPTVTFEQSKIFAVQSKQKLQEHCVNLGKIDNSWFTGDGIPKPPTPLGDNGKPRNWLLVSAGYEAIGRGGRVRKMWRLSGRRGWDELIYKNSAV